MSNIVQRQYDLPLGDNQYEYPKNICGTERQER